MSSTQNFYQYSVLLIYPNALEVAPVLLAGRRSFEMPVRHASDSQTAALGTHVVKTTEQLLPMKEARKTVQRCERLQTRMSEAVAEVGERQKARFPVQLTELAT